MIFYFERNILCIPGLMNFWRVDGIRGLEVDGLLEAISGIYLSVGELTKQELIRLCDSLYHFGFS